MSVVNQPLPNLELIDLLGRGGTAMVYRARQLSTGREVAVKVLDADFVRTQEDVNRFVNEAKACGRFQHRNIVRVYDAGAKDGFYWFVMELIGGYTFAQYLKKHPRLDPEDCMVILESVTSALSYAWQRFRVVHCDLKPDNLMVDTDGTIKLMDLGISRSIIDLNNENTHHINVMPEEGPEDEIMGTPAYMSPDQIYDLPDLDCRADIYSLGATLYHLLTGSILFPNKTDQEVVDMHVSAHFARDPRTLVPEIPRGLAIMLNRMLAKDRTLRYPNWETLAADIKRLYAGKTLLATPLKPGESSVAFAANL